MDLTHPLRSVAPSLDSAVLEVLAGTTRLLSGVQIAELARTGSVSGVRLVLRRLVAHGLVSRDDRGRSSYFAANRLHLAWPAIEELLHLNLALEDRIAAEVGAWELPPTALAIFGSAARYDAGPRSDIDLLVIEPIETLSQAKQWDDALAELATAVENWSGNRVHVTRLTIDELTDHVRSAEPIVDSWRSEARTLAGRDIRELIAEVDRASTTSGSGLHQG